MPRVFVRAATREGSWESATNRVLEPWADYGAALVYNPEEVDFIRELFPEETAIMEAMLEVTAQ